MQDRWACMPVKTRNNDTWLTRVVTSGAMRHWWMPREPGSWCAPVPSVRRTWTVVRLVTRATESAHCRTASRPWLPSPATADIRSPTRLAVRRTRWCAGTAGRGRQSPRGRRPRRGLAWWSTERCGARWWAVAAARDDTRRCSCGTGVRMRATHAPRSAPSRSATGRQTSPANQSHATNDLFHLTLPVSISESYSRLAIKREVW